MQSIVFGRILLRDDLPGCQNFIKSLGEDHVSPAISTDMFSLGGYQFYEEPIITFGATYKFAEYDWTSFMLKFEHILRNIDFIHAKIRLEGEIMGPYDFFWTKRGTWEESAIKKEKLIKTPEWLFGYGNRDLHGHLVKGPEDREVFRHEGFEYPVRYTDQQKDTFKSIYLLIKEDLFHVKQFPFKEDQNIRGIYDQVFPILNLLSFKKKLIFGFEPAQDKRGASIISADKFYIQLNEDLSAELSDM